MDGITKSVDMSVSKLWKTMKGEVWHAAIHWVSKIRTLGDRTTATWE